MHPKVRCRAGGQAKMQRLMEKMLGSWKTNLSLLGMAGCDSGYVRPE